MLIWMSGFFSKHLGFLASEPEERVTQPDMARKSWMGAEMSDVFHPQTQGLLGDRAV